MFRLLSCGLPKDPVFPPNLEGLGYFVNDEDEIRNIEDPKSYFKFFTSKNVRINEVQREAMNGAIRDIVIDRLLKLDITTVRLPLGAEAGQPHIPILISSNLKEKKRVFILLYEHVQDLGILAQRVVGGKGGINQGSAVNFVKAIQALRSGVDEDDSPGIILANLGQLRWYRRGQRAVSQMTWYALPQKSAVGQAPRYDPIKNTVQENRTTLEHVQCVFNQVIPQLAHPDAKLSVTGVSDGANAAVQFLAKDDNWKTWEKRIEALALLAPYYNSMYQIKNDDFKAWLGKRGRAYVLAPRTANTLLAGPEGNRIYHAFGCPTYSIGEHRYTELMLVKGYQQVLDWFQEVSRDPDYQNSEDVTLEDDGKNWTLTSAEIEELGGEIDWWADYLRPAEGTGKVRNADQGAGDIERGWSSTGNRSDWGKNIDEDWPVVKTGETEGQSEVDKNPDREDS